jgi:hypothetical protein
MCARPISPATFSAAIISILAAAPTSTPASAQVFTIISQERSTSSSVIAPLCPPGSDSDSEAAADFGPFNSLVGATLDCDITNVNAGASQDSDVQGEFSASGDSFAFAFSSRPMAIQSIAFSEYEVTVQVLQPASFAMLAELQASGNRPVLSSSVSSLTSDDGPVIFQDIVEPLAGGPNTLTVSHSGQLQPGIYTFHADSNTEFDANVPPTASGGAGFDVNFVIAAFGDLSGDDLVGAADLGQLLASWGRCPADALCLADLNGDGNVGAADLATILANWD